MKSRLLSLALLLVATVAVAEPLRLDERPAGDDQWGYRPADDSVVEVTPPGFCWRPQKNIMTWELECGQGDRFNRSVYRADAIAMNVHCPPRVLPPGEYAWRYRGRDEQGTATPWSQTRSFTIPATATPMPLPSRDQLLARIPKSHPRLFVRPEDLPRLRQLAQGPLRSQFDALVARCEKLLADPPPTREPRKYPPSMVRGSPEWKALWWGNRTYTIAALESAATLAFTRMVGGKEEYGQLAKQILLDCAEWDPKGATGFHYNDEAGMPYAYHFSRAYTFLCDLLDEDQRETCRRVMKVRGDAMYAHLYPRHLWQPYASHSNRSWHFLGEVAIAFSGEIEAADDWLWFAMNVFYNVYPVWSDDDGGWHEGVSYWSSYIGRFTWWADVMRSAVGVNAYDKPYFAKAGYYGMYLMPPGKVGAGFGDGATRRKAAQLVPLVSQMAAQAGNGHWQWYVERMGGPKATGGLIGFVRDEMPRVEPAPPDDLPTSRWFRGTGQAALNTTLTSAADDVQVLFKSSPMGTRSHGNAANNSFVLWAYGERLLVRSGHYYMYGGPHHRDWVWSTRSLNNITVNGQGQIKRSAAAKGRIVAFETTPAIDVVVGEAGAAYRVREEGTERRLLDRYTRAILFVKPELIVVFDRLEATQPVHFEYWLHALEKFTIGDRQDLSIRSGDVRCTIDLMAPSGLEFVQTDQYDPNPWPRIKTREWHLTAATPSAQKRCEFIALLRPHRAVQSVPGAATLERIEGGYILRAELADGRVVALLPVDKRATLADGSLATTGGLLVSRQAADGKTVQTIRLDYENSFSIRP